MPTEAAQTKDRLDRGEGTTRNRYTYEKFTDLQTHAQAFGIKTDRIPRETFTKEPDRYFAELTPQVKSILDRVPDEALTLKRESSLKPDALRQMVIRSYGLDGNPPDTLENLYTEYTGERNRQLVAKTLGKCRKYLKEHPLENKGVSSPTSQTNPTWDDGSVSKYYN